MAQQGARRLLDQQLQQEPGRHEAEKPRDEHEQDHVAEGDHTGGALRHVGRHEQLIDGDSGESADDAKSVARGDQSQLLSRAHAPTPASEENPNSLLRR